MADEIKVEVTLRWEGDKLYAGRYLLGDVFRHSRDKWIGVVATDATGYHATEHEARAAVEAAVTRALKREPKP